MTIRPVSLPGPMPADLLATSHLVRWHTKPTARHQSLADHLGMVAQLADHLGLHLGPDYGPDVALETLRYALQHDLPETEHGDIPNPAKRWLNQRLEGGRYDALVADTWWGDRSLEAPMPWPLAEKLVKVADILEACCWYWVYGLLPDLRQTLVFEAVTVCRRELPQLLNAVSDVLSAAGVPDGLISEAVA